MQMLTTGRRLALGLGVLLAGIACGESSPTEGGGSSGIVIQVTGGDVKPGAPFDINVSSGTLDSLATVTIGGVTTSAVLTNAVTVRTQMTSGTAGNVTVRVTGWMDGRSVSDDATMGRLASDLTVDAEAFVAAELDEIDAIISGLDAAPRPVGVDASTWAADNAQIAQLASDVSAQIAALSPADRAAFAEFVATIEAEAAADAAAAGGGALVRQMASEAGCGGLFAALNCLREAAQSLTGQRFRSYRFHVAATALVVGGIFVSSPVMLVAGGFFVLKSLSEQQRWASEASEAISSASVTIGAELDDALWSDLRLIAESGHTPPPFLTAPAGTSVPFRINRTLRSPTSADTDVPEVAELAELIEEHNSILDDLINWLGLDVTSRLPGLPSSPVTTTTDLATVEEIDIWAVSPNTIGATPTLTGTASGVTLRMDASPPPEGQRVFLEMYIGDPDGKYVPLQAAIYVTQATDCPETVSAGGATYPVVAIGGQCWMAENLRAPIGDLAVEDMDWAEPSHLDSDWTTNPKHTYSAGTPQGAAAWGFLYNWWAAQDACPGGWRLPSLADSQRLYASGEASGHGVAALMSRTETQGSWQHLSATNSLRFNSVPSGYRNGANVEYDDINANAWVAGNPPAPYYNEVHYFWTTDHETQDRTSRTGNPLVFVNGWTFSVPSGPLLMPGDNGAAVRCVQ